MCIGDEAMETMLTKGLVHLNWVVRWPWALTGEQGPEGAERGTGAPLWEESPRQREQTAGGKALRLEVSEGGRERPRPGLWAAWEPREERRDPPSSGWGDMAEWETLHTWPFGGHGTNPGGHSVTHARVGLRRE